MIAANLCTRLGAARPCGKGSNLAAQADLKILIGCAAAITLGADGELGGHESSRLRGEVGRRSRDRVQVEPRWELSRLP